MMFLKVYISSSPLFCCCGNRLQFCMFIMKIVIATDKFKGSLDSFAVGDAIERGLLQASSRFKIIKLPLSDGGDGLIAVMAHYTKAKKIFASVSDPLFRTVKAHYLLSEDGRTAIVEMAQASGLMRLQASEYNPLQATTFGTGQLLKAALQHGVSKIILGIGGSATNDAGIGMAAALGYRFLDVNSKELKPIGENLIRIETIDSTNKIPINDVVIEVACDVTNYLTGSDGAAKIYGPQKGATPEMVAALEKGMLHFALVAKQQMNIDLTTIKSGGAAGGAGAGGVLFLNADLISGVELLLQYSEAEKYIKDADFVITGEGKLDMQTMHGKVVRGVIDLCAAYKKPVVALCGTLDISFEAMYTAGLTAAFSIINKPMNLENAMNESEILLTNAAFNLGNFFKMAYPL